MQRDLVVETESRNSVLGREATTLKAEKAELSATLETERRDWQNRFEQLEQHNAARLQDMQKEHVTAMNTVEERLNSAVRDKGKWWPIYSAQYDPIML